MERIIYFLIFAIFFILPALIALYSDNPNDAYGAMFGCLCGVVSLFVWSNRHSKRVRQFMEMLLV